MSAVFIDIKKTLDEKKLRLPTLNVLSPDSQLYDVLAIQPVGEVAVTPSVEKPDFVGNADRAGAIAKFREFVRLAFELKSDLVLAPEYSLPWEVLDAAIHESKLPEIGRLWIFGCEAITPTNLQKFITAHSQVDWVGERIPNSPGRFLNTLIYVTRTTTFEGTERWLVAFQFKHEPMGGSTFERDHLIRGSMVHIWRNPQDNIRLISLICSDALTFSPDNAHECRFDRDPYLIFHPQLNSNPLQVDFGTYRGNLFGRNSDRFEVITLNWARNFSISGLPVSLYGGSTVYTKSPNFRFPDARIEHNHKTGLYFVYWDARRTQLFILNFQEHVFRLKMPKVLQEVLAVEAARTGPEMDELRVWEAPSAAWAIATSADDGFSNLCSSFNNSGCDYCTGASHTVLDRERLFMLSTGNLRLAHEAAGWQHVTNLDSFKAEADERSKRLTFTQEANAASITYRQDHLGRFITLQSAILANPAYYPSNIEDLKGDYKIVPPRAETNYRFNLESRGGGKAPATAVFVGAVPPDYAMRVRDDIVRIWGGVDLARRLVVWYQDPQAGFKSVQPPLPTVTDDSEALTSFARSVRS